MSLSIATVIPIELFFTSLASAAVQFAGEMVCAMPLPSSSVATATHICIEVAIMWRAWAGYSVNRCSAQNLSGISRTRGIRPTFSIPSSSVVTPWKRE